MNQSAVLAISAVLALVPLIANLSAWLRARRATVRISLVVDGTSIELRGNSSADASAIAQALSKLNITADLTAEAEVESAATESKEPPQETRYDRD
ncbi:effector-associated constant component EACC1 [Nocardia sp. KC 131]|uniref:effector-associated constant component EACC1 n=1 Tax=Nocardia arseniciresistens TaxID=3392119 RepID=UPI00398EDB22